MKPLDNIMATARADARHIVMAEGEDPRIVKGSARAVRNGMAKITLVGERERIEAQLRLQNVDPALMAIIDPMHAEQAQDFARSYHELRKHRKIDEAAAREAVRRPLNFAAMMVHEGLADGTVGGAVATTADTVRAALQIIGRAPESKLVSSFFLMVLCEGHHIKKGALIFADCGLVVEPDAGELAEIARASAQSFAALIKDQPKVAMLSFSTQGSARHERVTKVAEATRLARLADKELLIEGDIQFDAAFVPAVSTSKAPGSPLKGQANVFVFPNLDAANISYKIAERVGGAKAIGPILQGLAKPANDLSRGCSTQDVYHMIAVTVVQAQNLQV